MENLQVFKNEMFGEIRVVERDNEPWFVGKDVAQKLGYKNLSDSIGKHVDNDDKMQIAKHDLKNQTDIGTKGAILINESGLYSLILSSKLQSAKEFKRWVTKDVLPAIRQTGGYIPTNEEDDEESLMAKALIVAQKTLDRKNQKIKQLETDVAIKEDIIDTVIDDKGLFAIGDVGRVLKSYNDYFGARKIFEYMRNKDILMNSEGSNKHNLPYAAYGKYFNIKYIEIGFKTTTKVYFTGKGLKWFLNYIAKDGLLAINQCEEIKKSYNL